VQLSHEDALGASDVKQYPMRPEVLWPCMWRTLHVLLHQVSAERLHHPATCNGAEQWDRTGSVQGLGKARDSSRRLRCFCAAGAAVAASAAKPSCAGGWFAAAVRARAIASASGVCIEHTVSPGYRMAHDPRRRSLKLAWQVGWPCGEGTHSGVRGTHAASSGAMALTIAPEELIFRDVSLQQVGPPAPCIGR